MKKNLCKFGSLALAIALVFALAACEQSTDDASGSAGAPTIVRLYLDRPDNLTLKAGDILELRVGEELLVGEKLINYPYPMTLKPNSADVLNKTVQVPADGNTPATSGSSVYYKGYGSVDTNGDGTDDLFGDTIDNITGNKDRTKVIAIPPYRSTLNRTMVANVLTPTGNIRINGHPEGITYTSPVIAAITTPGTTAIVDSVIQTKNAKKKFLYSGSVQLRETQLDSTTVGAPIAVTPKGQYYVDIELINKNPADKDYDNIFSGSVSGYLELAVGPSQGIGYATLPAQPSEMDYILGTAPCAGGMKGAYYMYTKDKHGFNDFQTQVGAVSIWKIDNANIKKVSLKPGVNELYLSNFSFVQNHDVDLKVW